jgi:GNAT superfamily N-acetyltransferase
LSKVEVTYQPLQGGFLTQALPLLSQQTLDLLDCEFLQGFGAQYGRDVVGVTLFRTQGGCMVLEDIRVAPQYRRNGIGSDMLRALCALAQKRRMDLLFSFGAEGLWDSFYRFVASTHLFFLQRESGCTALLRVEEVQALCRKYPRCEKEPTRFFQLSRVAREEFIGQLEADYPDIAWELRSDHPEYREDLCCCTVSGGQVQGACFMKEHNGELELKLLYARPGKGPYAAKALTQTIGELGQSQLMPVRFSPVGDAAMRIMDSLCPVRHIEQRIYTAYNVGSSQQGGEDRA